MGVSMHYVKIVGGGIVVAGLVVAVIVLAVLLAQEKKNNGGTTDRPWDAEYRLPAQIEPEHYDLLIHPDSDMSTFTGQLTLTFTVNGTLAFVPLHQKGLNVSNPVITETTPTPSGRSPKAIAVRDSFDAPLNEFFIIRPEAALPTGSYKVSVDFSGSLTQPELVGIYSSTYKDPVAVKKLVTSKFEPTYARRAFPCLDEPDKKAFFTISLVRPSSSDWSALSNMNEARVTQGPGNDEVTVHFEKSVKMSTYLACFIVSEFNNVESEVTNQDGSKFPLRTYAPKSSVKNTQFANDAANDITKYYIEYFGIDYPLPKLDLIAIPDFVSGAMEHWGLITFRETNMIVDLDSSAVSNQQQVGMVVAHELAHMWFGNLVTMKWWDDLWLNEGFASYIEYKGFDHFRPDWRLMDQFLIMDLQPVMALDAQLSSHPIIQPVAHPDQITELFDTITYSKGSSVIRMLEGMLGDEVFKNGVRLYLNNFKYENAETKDLWAALTQAALDAGLSVDVKRVMNTWTLQMGLPVVEVAYEKVSGKTVLRQKRFFGSQGAEKKAAAQKEASPYAYRWDIPLTYITNNLPAPQKKWFEMQESTVEISVDPQLTTWIKFNRDQIGFYRVNYDADMWKHLAAASKRLEMPPTDRSSLLDDVFSLADGGYVEYGQALDFAKSLETENDYIPWSTASSKFLKLLPLIKTRGAYPDFKRFVEHLVKTQYEALQWAEKPSDDFISKRLRSTVLNLACSCGYEECLKAVTVPFFNWVEKNEQQPANTRQLIYNFGMSRDGHKNGNWDKVLEKYKKETDPQEKLKLMISLTYVRDKPTLLGFLELAENEEIVRGQDYFTVLQSMSDNDFGQPIVWEFVRKNWEALVERFTLNSRSLGRLIPRITQNFDTTTQLDEMKAFFVKYPEAGAGASARKQALERVEANIQWVELHYQKIENWLHAWELPRTA